MPSIHLVERLGNVHPVDRKKNEWESGYWAVSEETALKLVGGHIYLHKGQDKQSHFGGQILGCRVHITGPEEGRIVFRFRDSIEFKGVSTGRDGWGNEKKIVW